MKERRRERKEESKRRKRRKEDRRSVADSFWNRPPISSIILLPNSKEDSFFFSLSLILSFCLSSSSRWTISLYHLLSPSAAWLFPSTFIVLLLPFFLPPKITHETVFSQKVEYLSVEQHTWLFVVVPECQVAFQQEKQGFTATRLGERGRERDVAWCQCKSIQFRWKNQFNWHLIWFSSSLPILLFFHLFSLLGLFFFLTLSLYLFLSYFFKTLTSFSSNVQEDRERRESKQFFVCFLKPHA